MSGFSRDRIGKIQNTLKQLFETAIDNRIILSSPAVRLRPPKASNGTHRSITPYERSLTLEIAKYHHAGSWILTMLFCGQRPQETAALKGHHVDKKAMVIHIEQALKADGNIDMTKTTAGKRDVPLPTALLPYFKKVPSFDFAFKSPKGYPLTKKSMNDMWHSFKREMQIKAGCRVFRNQLSAPFPIASDLVPYCYRHSFCTDLQDAGIPINVAKDLMGHASITVTASIYTHMTENQLLD